MRCLNFFILAILLCGASFLHSAPSAVPSVRLCSLYDDYQHIVAEHERRKQEEERQRQEKEKEENEKKAREEQEKGK